MDTVPTLSGAGVFGHLGEFRKQPQALLNRFNREIGDLGWLRFVNVRLLVVNTPQLVHDLLVTQAGRFRKSRVLRAGLYPLVGEGLFTSEGELWKRQRKLMAPIFQAKRIAAFDTCMTDCALRCVEAWSDGQSIDALHETTSIAMSVASRAFFGADTSGEENEIGRALTFALEWAAEAMTSTSLAVQLELADGLARATSWLPGTLGKGAERLAERLEQPIMWPTAKNRELRDAVTVLDDYVAKLIAERRADPGAHQDLLSRLLTAHEGVDDAAMSDRQLRDEILTLFVAGHETTATTLAWSLYLLARHPDVRAELEAEADALEHDVPTADDLPRLAVSTRVFKEALRMYPPVPVYERQATEPVSVGDIELDTSDYVAVFPWALQHREDLWPEPTAFAPRRFTPEAESNRSRYAWIPFGAGPRVCIGNHFAMQEGPLVLSTIARRARLELVEDHEIDPDPQAATLRPLGGVPMRVVLRDRYAHGHGHGHGHGAAAFGRG